MKDKSDTSLYRRYRNAVKNTRSGLVEAMGTFYDRYLVADIEECPYFPEDLDSFGVLLKGKSLEQFATYAKEFDDCFMVNNFDKEIEAVGPSLQGKRCVQFVNRLMTAALQKEYYERFAITDIQLPKVSAFKDRKLKKPIDHYKSLGLKMHLLPKKLLKFNREDFDEEYTKKYPNTGILAIIYALEMLRPRTLWIIGLDFYQKDYLFRRSHQNPIEVQRAKMDRINMVDVTANIFRRFPDVKINMVSYYEGFPEVPNVKILRGESTPA